MVKLRVDEAKHIASLYEKKISVVIEELEEPPKRTPTPKRRFRPTPNPEPQMLPWYEPDIEFQEYLVTSLEEDKKRKKRAEDTLCAALAEDLMRRFNEEGIEDGSSVVEDVGLQQVVGGSDIVEVVGLQPSGVEDAVMEDALVEETVADGVTIEEAVADEVTIEEA